MLTKIEKTWNEFWAYYWRITDRYQIAGIFEWDKKLVDLIENVCDTTPPMKVLDLGCGGGDQAKVFAERGYTVVGLDVALPLVTRAQELFKNNRLAGMFITDDMRNIEYSDEFNLCTLLSGTFGFFDEDGNFELLKKIHRALKKGGKVFIMYISPFYTQKKTRKWNEIDGGYELSETWFDMETSTYRSTTRLILDDGTVLVPAVESGYHANEVIRCYTNPEIERMLKDVGFKDIKHLSRKQINDPKVSLEPWDTRDIVVATKQ